MIRSFIAIFLIFGSTSVALAEPIDDVLHFCKTDTDMPSRAKDMAIKMPDGHPRGTRNAVTLTAEALKARDAGNCSAAVDWLTHAVEHDEGAKNVLRADPAKTCRKL